MQKDSKNTNLLLEIVDENKTLIAHLPAALAFRDHLPYRAVGSFIADEQGCMLLTLTQEGLLTLPILSPLPAGDSREETVCALAKKFIPYAHPYNERLLTELWMSQPAPCVLSLYHMRIAHATLVRKTADDAQVLLLSPIEQKGLLSDTSGLSQPLAQASAWLAQI
ncbi:MAG: hypothetical protein IJU76_14640 [Desulfovibrionaceae bacterium]|nr:hypothetical protein [Desulfovibrionaceae bacterium]